MNNKEKLKNLLMDILLLDEHEFNFELKKDQVDTWDSLGVVSIAVGVQETFSYHLTPEEATSINSVNDIVIFLEKNGVNFDE